MPLTYLKYINNLKKFKTVSRGELTKTDEMLSDYGFATIRRILHTFFNWCITIRRK